MAKNSKKIFFVTICFLVAIAVVMQLFLPFFYSQRIKTEIEKDWDLANSIEVQVKAFPFTRLLLGRMDKLSIEGDSMSTGTFQADHWEFVFEGVDMRNNHDGYSKLNFEDGRGTVWITEETLNTYLKDRSPDWLEPQIKIGKEQLIYTGMWDIGIILIPFTLKGHPVITEEGNIVLRVDRASFGDWELPEGARKIAEGFQINFANETEEGKGKQMMGLMMSRIELAEGKMAVRFEKSINH